MRSGNQEDSDFTGRLVDEVSRICFGDKHPYRLSVVILIGTIMIGIGILMWKTLIHYLK